MELDLLQGLSEDTELSAALRAWSSQGLRGDERRSQATTLRRLLRAHLDTGFAAFAQVWQEEGEEGEEGLRVRKEEGLGALLVSAGLGNLLRDCLSTVVHEIIDKYVRSVAAGEHGMPMFDKIRAWLQGPIYAWVSGILASEKSFDMAAFKGRLEFHMFDAFCDLRVAEMFDIIADFPDSIHALRDLKLCLAHTHSERKLVRSLLRAFQQRLLHPGASTNSILSMYVRTIKSLRILDPSGLLLSHVSNPVKEYLRFRPETVRCVVSALTGDADGELSEELSNELGGSPSLENASQDAKHLVEDDENDPLLAAKWQPVPVEVDCQNSNVESIFGSKDVIGMLVQIYGSNELFVNEYHLLLAEKLTGNLNFDIDREVLNLELLKLRFGDAAMHSCEIMLRDMANSKRVNTNLSTLHSSKLGPFEATIISRHYWPPLGGESEGLSLGAEGMKLHPIIQEQSEAFGEQFSIMKASQKLIWKHESGTTSIELEFKDGQSRKFDVSTIHANLISYFNEDDAGNTPVWRAKDLAKEVEFEVSFLRKKMAYWVNQGVIKERYLVVENDVEYHAAENLANDGEESGMESMLNGSYAMGAEGSSMMMMADDDDITSAVNNRGPGDAQFQDMQKYVQFIEGMLRNLGEIGLEGIHNNLSMFLQTGDFRYDKTVHQLDSFLNYLVSTEKLEKGKAGYRLVDT